MAVRACSLTPPRLELLRRADALVRRLARDADYDRQVQALRCVEEVRGYREIRYPKMEETKRKVEALLNTSAPATAKHSVFV